MFYRDLIHIEIFPKITFVFTSFVLNININIFWVLHFSRNVLIMSVSPLPYNPARFTILGHIFFMENTHLHLPTLISCSWSTDFLKFTPSLRDQGIVSMSTQHKLLIFHPHADDGAMVQVRIYPYINSISFHVVVWQLDL